MLPKSYRLPASEKFPSPTSVSLEFVRILVKSNNLPNNRFGFVVSKKIDKRAVVRNRLKRVLREGVKDFMKNATGQDALFIVKKSFVEIPTEEVVAIVGSVLKKIL